MNRLLVLVLAAIDAVLTVAIGVAVAFAPLALLWVFAFGADAAWLALWPAAVRLWQLGNLVPLDIALPGDYAVAANIPAEGAAFALSLAPAAFALFAGVAGARSGRRAARSGAWIAGVAAGTVTTAALAFLLQLTAHNEVVSAAMPLAIAMPTLVFAVPALLAALTTVWTAGDDSALARARASTPARFAGVPSAVLRGTAAALTGTVGVGALLVVVALLLRGTEVIALYEASGADLIGALTIALGQLAYLPVLVVWAASFAAGPGFALGSGTSVMPAGTSIGVVPGIPVLGAIPPTTSPVLLALALLIVGVGAVAGLVARRALAERSDADGLTPRLTALGGIVVAVGLSVLALGSAAGGSIGPGTLAETGPAPGPFALAVAIETGIGAAILLLAPGARPSSSHLRDFVDRMPATPRRAPASDPDTHPTEEIPRLPGP